VIQTIFDYEMPTEEMKYNTDYTIKNNKERQVGKLESRTFATAILTMPGQGIGYEWKKTTIHRHLAWLLALKHNMRKVRTWEHNSAV
jgi:hypothetical protein